MFQFCGRCLSRHDIFIPKTDMQHVWNFQWPVKHDIVSQPIHATSCDWGGLVRCWLVGITTHGTSLHHNRPNKNAFKRTSAFITLSPHPPNQPGLHSRHIKNHKIPLCILQAEQTGREKKLNRGGSEEWEWKQTIKLEGVSYQIFSDWRLVAVIETETLLVNGGLKEQERERERGVYKERERKMHNS